jgi:hypothetical protein
MSLKSCVIYACHCSKRIYQQAAMALLENKQVAFNAAWEIFR